MEGQAWFLHIEWSGRASLKRLISEQRTERYKTASPEEFRGKSCQGR